MTAVDGRVLLLGGARSGKSHEAERRMAAEPAVDYIATARTDAGDAEWTARIAEHQARRPTHWRTVETTDVALELRRDDGPAVIVDCLTLWLAAAMDDSRCWDDATTRAASDEALTQRVDDLVEAWRGTGRQVVAVSNEVGSGVVPATPAGRRWRDELGRLNARVAAESDEVWLLVAGVPLRIR